MGNEGEGGTQADRTILTDLDGGTRLLLLLLHSNIDHFLHPISRPQSVRRHAYHNGVGLLGHLPWYNLAAAVKGRP